MDPIELSLDQGCSVAETGSQGASRHLLLLDADFTIQGASPSFYSTFQIAPGQATGKKLDQLCNGEWDAPGLLKLLHQLRGEFDDLEMEFDVPALGRRSILISARRLMGGDGQNGMTVLSMQDVTGPGRCEVDACDLPARFRVSFSSLGYALIVTDRENRVVFMNSTAETLTGWAHGDALDNQLTDVFNIVSEQLFQPMENPVARAIREHAAVSLAKYSVLISRNGKEWPIDGRAARILDAAGCPAGAVVVFQDISDRRKLEREKEISEVRYRRLFESAHDGILILDAATGKVLDVNPAVADLLGYSREHFLGRELWEIGVSSDAETSKNVMKALEKHGRIRYDDLRLQHKDGRQVPVELVSNVYPEGRRNVMQCNIRDITERKRVAEDLQKARQDAEIANKSKSDFLANMSHEIRTPMGAILGFAEMLLHKSPEECAQIGCVQIIQRNSLQLLELINEILDLSKVEAGQMKVESVSCDLPALLADLMSLMRPKAAEKGLGFGITFQGPIPRLIQSDPLRLRQILVNLLGNAVKFTESGRVDLRVMDEGAGGPKILLRVDVTDTGIGMTPEQLDRLFLPFTQGDVSTTRKFGGTGLGLTISRQLANLLGGDVIASSNAGKGSTFTLKVQGGPSAGVEQLQGLTEALLPQNVSQTEHVDIRLEGRILLAEDGPDNQRLLRMELGDAGATVTSALDGRIAVELATQQTFDLILMDMQMPVMDGYAATVELRKRGITTPIVALTAYAMAEDRQKCIASGCSGYLSKPIDEETLLRTVSKHLGNEFIPMPDHIALPQADSSKPAIDSSPIKSSHINNPQIMEIVPEFVAGLPGKVAQITDMLARKDSAALQRIAHQLLGTCGGYGFAAVSAPARTVEQSIKGGKSLDSVVPEVQALIAVIRRIDGYDRSREVLPVEELVK